MWPSRVPGYLGQGRSVHKKTKKMTPGQRFRHGCWGRGVQVKESFWSLLFTGVSLFPSSSMPLSFCYQIQKTIKPTEFTKRQVTSMNESSYANTTLESSKYGSGSDYPTILKTAPFLFDTELIISINKLWIPHFYRQEEAEGFICKHGPDSFNNWWLNNPPTSRISNVLGDTERLCLVGSNNGMCSNPVWMIEVFFSGFLTSLPSSGIVMKKQKLIQKKIFASKLCINDWFHSNL